MEGDTDINDSLSNSEEEEKKQPKRRIDTREAKIEIKRRGYGPKAFGKELYKDPQDRSRGFIKQLFFGKKMEITETGKRKEDTIEELDFFQIFLSVMAESNLYDAWDAAFQYSFDSGNKQTFHKRTYVLSTPDVFTFQLMRATYDFNENRLKKINTKFEFEKEIYIDRFLYQN